MNGFIKIMLMTLLSGAISLFPLLAIEPELLAQSELPQKPEGAGRVFIKGGCYEMGDSFGDGQADEKPLHSVCVNDFNLAEYDVTVGEFRQFVNATGYQSEAEKNDGCFGWTGKKYEYSRDFSWRNPGFFQGENHPVVCVSWNDASEYIAWKNRETGQRYRLPTEAEWEYAARSGGKKNKYSWGNERPAGNVADESLQKYFKEKYDRRVQIIWDGYNDGYECTSPVGSFKPNELGLYDMTGNVWQWLADWYGEKYYEVSPKNNPQGPLSGEYRVFRGGSWLSSPSADRASYRDGITPDRRDYVIGFRLALSRSGQ